VTVVQHGIQLHISVSGALSVTRDRTTMAESLLAHALRTVADADTSVAVVIVRTLRIE
jgi:hypothetical protein